MKIIFTSQDKVDDIYLKEETGYWTDKCIYVYTKNKSKIKIIGILIHELIEYLLEYKLKMNHRYAHNIANIFESILTLGKCEEQIWM